MSDTSGPSLRERVEASRSDREVLALAICDQIKDTYKMALAALEEALPDHRTPGSGDARVFQILRTRILNDGNARCRAVRPMLRAWEVTELFKQSVETHTITGRGPYDLPPGVKLRGEPEE